MKPSKMSLKSLYYDILLHIADEMTKEDKDKFRFWADVHSDLPKRILENPQILDWFIELRRKGKISFDNLVYLEDFLKHSGLEALFKDVQNYKTERELMLRSMKKTTKEKTSAKQKGTRMKSHVFEEQAPKSLRDMEPSKMSLKILYYKILLHTADNMTKEDKVKFKFWSHLHSDLPKRILENPEPLDWFIELHRKGKIGPDNLLYLEDFLQHSGLEALLKDVENHKTERQLMLMSMMKTTKDKTSAKQKGTRIKSHVVQEQAPKRLGREFISLKRKQSAGKNRDRRKNRNRGMAFVLFEDGINALLESSSLRESERKSLSWNINMMAYQLFGHSVDTPRCRNSSNSQCSSGGNPSIKCSNSQCSSGGNSSIKCSNSQCSSGGNPSIKCSNSQRSSGDPSVKCSSSQCSSGENPSIKCSRSQCSSGGNPSIKCSNNQCSSGENPSIKCSRSQYTSGDPSIKCSNSQCSIDRNPSIKCSNSQCSIDRNPSITCSNSQCSIDRNPSITCSNSQCSLVRNPSIKCSNSECSLDRHPSMDIKSVSSIESLHQRTTSHSMVRSVLGYIVLALGAFTLSAALNLVVF